MKIVAHRGYSGKYPELTRVAFEEALKLPIEGVECDVRLSRDGKVVVQHDKTLNRTSDGSGLVATTDWIDLCELNIGTEECPEPMMLLDELLELMQDYPDKELFLETKHPSRFGGILEEQVALRLRYADMHEDPRVSIISFSHAAMRRCAKMLPKLDTYYLLRGCEERWNKKNVMLSRPQGIGPSILRAKATPEVIGWKGLHSYVWTVDDPEDMIWCRDHGVEVLATNLPELALETLR